jgi:predicted permease
VLQVAAPVFLIPTIGFGWVRLGFEYRLEFVTRLATSLAVPCLVFTSLMGTTLAPQALSAVFVASVVVMALLSALAWVIVRIARLEVRSYLLPLIFGNTGNLGLPLALFAFGEDGLALAVVVFAVGALWQFSFGVWVVSGGGSVLRLGREPLVWAALLGGLFLWQGWSTPLWLTQTLTLLGQMAIPLMLLTLGVAVARLAVARMGRAVWLSALRAALGVALAWAVAAAIGLSPMAAGVLILQMTMPVAVTGYLLTAKYGGDSDAVAGMVVASTLMSLITIPVILAFIL